MFNSMKVLIFCHFDVLKNVCFSSANPIVLKAATLNSVWYLAQIAWYVVVILWVFSQYLVALLEHCRWYVFGFCCCCCCFYRWRSLTPWAYTSKKSLFVLLQCLNLYCYDIFKNVHLYTCIMMYFSLYLILYPFVSLV